MFDMLKKKLKESVEKITKAVKSKDEPKSIEPEMKPQEAVLQVQTPPLPPPIEEKQDEAKEIVETPKEEIHKEIVEEAVKEIDEKKSADAEIVEVQELQKELELEKEIPKPQPRPELPPPIEHVHIEPKAAKKQKKPGLLKRVFSGEVQLKEEDIAPVLDGMILDLAEGDVALEVSEKIISDLRSSLVGATVKKKETESFVLNELKSSLTGIFSQAGKLDFNNILDNAKSQKRPCIIIFLGFNGSGKTTSLAKLASYLKEHNYSCVMAAADTFRAASIEQLEEHASRLKIPVIKHKYGSDAAAVIYDAVEHAKARNVNVVLADTAGRSHSNANLMDELKKVCRVNKSDMKILVVDSLTGNDAVEQAMRFNEAVGVDAIVLTKADVNPKGGAALSIVHAIKKPILFLGTGQAYGNLELFDPENFVNGLLR